MTRAVAAVAVVVQAALQAQAQVQLKVRKASVPGAINIRKVSYPIGEKSI